MSRKILVIEDDRDIARLVELHLRDLGCEVHLAHDGAVGLEQALSKSYDLVIALTNGGPGRSTWLPSVFMYQYTFTRNEDGGTGQDALEELHGRSQS